MIKARIYPKKRILRRRVEWRFRFVAENGQPYGHDYDEPRYAEKSLRRVVSPNIGVELEIEHLDGTVEKIGRIR